MIKKIKWLFISVLILFMTHGALATEGVLQPISIDVHNKERLQRGAKLFMNYCSGCHSLKYMRYDRLADDLGLKDFAGKINDNLLNNLIFTQAKSYEPIQIAMLPEDAQQWFGVVPPDLSLSARERGATWLYQYLKSFYNDRSRPFGVNNLLVPNVAMPNVLEPLIGQVIRVTHQESQVSSLLLEQNGSMRPAEFDDALQDLVTFLVYVGEPAQLIRYRLGFFVIIFLVILLIPVYCLKKMYWWRFKF